MECSAPYGTSISYSFPPEVSGNILEDGVGKLVRAKVREDCLKITSFGYDMAIALMISQCLWLPVKDLHKIKLAYTPA